MSKAIYTLQDYRAYHTSAEVLELVQAKLAAVGGILYVFPQVLSVSECRMQNYGSLAVIEKSRLWERDVKKQKIITRPAVRPEAEFANQNLPPQTLKPIRKRKKILAKKKKKRPTDPKEETFDMDEFRTWLNKQRSKVTRAPLSRSTVQRYLSGARKVIRRFDLDRVPYLNPQKVFTKEECKQDKRALFNAFVQVQKFIRYKAIKEATLE